MDVVALTGTIGSGKSSAVREFADLGVPTLDADQLAREVVLPGTEGLKEVTEEFGSDVLQEDGTLDRKKLGKLIFSDPAKREALEQILHPKIRKLFLLKVDEIEHAQPDAPFVLYEIPLFFESNYPRDQVAAVLVVYAPEEVLLDRIMKRDGSSQEDAKKRLASQMPIDEKVNLADYVINNDSDRANLKLQVEATYKELLKDLGHSSS